MSIYHIPYTYLIGWSNRKKYYYGVRYAKNCHPSDLWKSYFTSSNHVKQFREEYGEPDIIQIRKIFSNKNAAVKWELKFLHKIKAASNPYFLNKVEAPARPILKELPEFKNICQKISNTMSGRKLTESHKLALRTSSKNKGLGIKKTQQHINNMGTTCISPNGTIYNTISEAARKTDIKYSTLYKWIINNKNGWSIILPSPISP